jgi:ABC-type nitrate/sulfonate/bicarbonate transport system permease component
MEQGRRLSQWPQRLLEAIGLAAALVLVWQVTTMMAHELFFPTPVRIAERLAHDWITVRALSADVMPSFTRVLLGWGCAAVLGVAAGVIIAQLKPLQEYVDPLIHFARAVPPPAALPIFLILFGIGSSMKVIFIAFGVVWPILINTAKGVKSIDLTLLDTARVYGVRGTRHLLHVILPAAAPEIFAGLRISLALGFVLMVISEMISASGGIGYQILQSQANFDVVNMWAGMTVLAIGGILFSSLLLGLESVCLHWQRGSKRSV